MAHGGWCVVVGAWWLVLELVHGAWWLVLGASRAHSCGSWVSWASWQERLCGEAAMCLACRRPAPFVPGRRRFTGRPQGLQFSGGRAKTDRTPRTPRTWRQVLGAWCLVPIKSAASLQVPLRIARSTQSASRGKHIAVGLLMHASA